MEKITDKLKLYLKQLLCTHNEVSRHTEPIEKHIYLDDLDIPKGWEIKDNVLWTAWECKVCGKVWN